MKRSHVLLTSMILAINSALPGSSNAPRVTSKKQRPLVSGPAPGRGKRRGRIASSLGFRRCTFFKPNGEKECARRRQIKAGTMTPNYVHGNQYLI